MLATHTLPHTQDPELQHTLSEPENTHTVQMHTDAEDPQTQYTHTESLHTHITVGEDADVCVDLCAEADQSVCAVCMDEESVCEEESVCGPDVCCYGEGRV